MRRLRPVLAAAAALALAACAPGGGSTPLPTPPPVSPSPTSPLTGSAASSQPTPQPGTAGTPGAPVTPGASKPCEVDALGRPTSCKALLGVATSGGADAVRDLEATAGRGFDIVYRYHDLDSAFPDRQEQALLERGSLLHIAIASRFFNGPSVRYADVAAGKHDAALKAQAQGVKQVGRPVFVTFEQEANQRDKVGPNGTPAEYIAAWRHVRELYRSAGATNAVFVWVMTGMSDGTRLAAQLWPGNDAVDWISWNVYNASGCRANRQDILKYRGFEDALVIFYDWLQTEGKAVGIDVAKPMMISEAGSVRYASNPGKAAEWYSGIPAGLAKYPNIQAITLWSGQDNTDGKACDYRWQADATTAAGVKAAAAQLSQPR